MCVPKHSHVHRAITPPNPQCVTNTAHRAGPPSCCMHAKCMHHISRCSQTNRPKSVRHHKPVRSAQQQQQESNKPRSAQQQQQQHKRHMHQLAGHHRSLAGLLVYTRAQLPAAVHSMNCCIMQQQHCACTFCHLSETHTALPIATSQLERYNPTKKPTATRGPAFRAIHRATPANNTHVPAGLLYSKC